MPDHVPVHQALAAVMADVQAVAKGDRNTQQGFSFRGIDAVVNAVGPALRRHGLVVLPVKVTTERTAVEVGRNRTPMGHVTVTVTYRFVGPLGDHLETTVAGEAMDAGDKATPKAMSVAFRTALLQGLALPTDEPDPDADTYERTHVRDQAPRTDDPPTDPTVALRTAIVATDTPPDAVVAYLRHRHRVDRLDDLPAREVARLTAQLTAPDGPEKFRAAAADALAEAIDQPQPTTD